jgi:hypothetical protein
MLQLGCADILCEVLKKLHRRYAKVLAERKLFHITNDERQRKKHHANQCFSSLEYSHIK